MVPERVAIIGANLAGARAAEALRQRGYDGELLLIGEEQLRPYERPPLSKDVLTKEDVQPQWVHAESFYADRRIELVTDCRVAALSLPRPRSFELQLSDGRKRQADTVLLATGGAARRLQGAGGAVHYLRRWEDSLRLRDALVKGSRVVVIGSGFIGAEVAASAVARGCNVTVVEAMPRLFPSVPSQAVAQAMARIFEDAGIAAVTGQQVIGIAAQAKGASVHLAHGRVLQADTVVAGIGIEPRVELARMVGAKLGRGVLVDPQFRTTVPGLYAAGDVCSIMAADGSTSHIEHWKAAQEQGAAAAHAILRLPLPQLSQPWCWSDQLGHRIEVAGSPRHSDEQVVRHTGSSELCVFHLREGRLAGAVSLNALRPMRMAMRLIGKPGVPNPAQLADPSVAINAVAFAE